MTDIIKQILAALSGLFKSQQPVYVEIKENNKPQEKEKMSRTVLKKGDGINTYRRTEKIIDDVKALQRFLWIKPDGMFGSGTEKEVKAFQSTNGLVADGIVGGATWKRLEHVSHSTNPTLNAFRGDLKWVHAREGHAGRAYWPGGASGVTLDPGFDLGHAKPDLFEEAYKDILSEEELESCRKVLGLKAIKAKEALADADPVLKALRMTREEADNVFPFVATPYWNAITERFPVLLEEDCPEEVQTVMLSISFNRGPGNKGLNVLNNKMDNKDWDGIGNEIKEMQQNHKLEGIRKRRRMEGELILNRKKDN